MPKLDWKLWNSTVEHPLGMCVLSPGLCKLVGIGGGALVAVDVIVSGLVCLDRLRVVLSPCLAPPVVGNACTVHLWEGHCCRALFTGMRLVALWSSVGGWWAAFLVQDLHLNWVLHRVDQGMRTLLQCLLHHLPSLLLCHSRCSLWCAVSSPCSYRTIHMLSKLVVTALCAFIHCMIATERNMTYRIFAWQHACIAMCFSSPQIWCSRVSVENFSGCLWLAFILQQIKHSPLALELYICPRTIRDQIPTPVCCTSGKTDGLNGVVQIYTCGAKRSIAWRKAQNIWQSQCCWEQILMLSTIWSTAL